MYLINTYLQIYIKRLDPRKCAHYLAVIYFVCC